MLGNKFYFASVRKHVAAFGKQFSDVYVQRRSGLGATGTVLKTIRVPLAYGSKQKWLSYVRQNEQRRKGGKMDIRTQLPRMAFEMTGIVYDANRKLNTIHRNTNVRIADPDLRNFLAQLNPVPYTLSFDLHIMTKNLDDMLQIVESIVPFFTPQRNVTVKEIEQLGITHDCPIIMQGNSMQDTYEGSFEDERVLSWTFNFVMPGQIYPPISDTGLIEKVFARFYGDDEMTKLTAEIETFVPEEDMEDLDISDQDAIIEAAISEIEEFVE